MIATRTIKELLVVVRDNLKTSNLHSGLCGFVDQLHSGNIITNTEMHLLHKFISGNRPKVFTKHYDLLRRCSAWYWKPTVKEPRIKWLDYMIDKDQ